MDIQYQMGRNGMSAKYSKQVETAFKEISIGDYHVDSDGHWLTLKPEWEYMGGRIVHDWTAKGMLQARRIVEKCP